MKLKKMLKMFLSDTNIVLADVDRPANANGYSAFFPTVFREIRTLGTAKELRLEINSWKNIDNYDALLAGITNRIGEQGEEKYIVLYFRCEE